MKDIIACGFSNSLVTFIKTNGVRKNVLEKTNHNMPENTVCKCIGIRWNASYPNLIAVCREFSWGKDTCSIITVFNPKGDIQHEIELKRERVQDFIWIWNNKLNMISLTDKGVNLHNVLKKKISECKRRGEEEHKEGEVRRLRLDPTGFNNLIAISGRELWLIDPGNVETKEMSKVYVFGSNQVGAQLCFDWIDSSFFIVGDALCDNPRLYFGVMEPSNKESGNARVNEEGSVRMKIIRINSLNNLKQLRDIKERIQISTFATIPKTRSILIVLSFGYFVEVLFQLKEYPLVSISPKDEIAVSFQGEVYITQPDPRTNKEHLLTTPIKKIKAISDSVTLDTMISRLKKGYGLDMCKNEELSANFEQADIKETWQYVATICSLANNEKNLNISLNLIKGIPNALLTPSFDAEETHSGHITIHTSQLRDYILNCFGWARCIGSNEHIEVFFSLRVELLCEAYKKWRMG